MTCQSPRPRSFAAVDASAQANSSTGANALSFGDFSTPRAEHDELQEVWVNFLERNFGSHEEAALFFGVDESAARHWKNGRNGLNAKRLVKAARSFPALRQMLFGAS